MIFISVGTEPSLFLFKIPLIHGGLIKVENVGLIEKYKVTTTQKEKKKKVSASSKAPKSNSKEELSFPYLILSLTLFLFLCCIPFEASSDSPFLLSTELFQI